MEKIVKNNFVMDNKLVGFKFDYYTAIYENCSLGNLFDLFDIVDLFQDFYLVHTIQQRQTLPTHVWTVNNIDFSIKDIDYVDFNNYLVSNYLDGSLLEEDFIQELKRFSFRKIRVNISGQGLDFLRSRGLPIDNIIRTKPSDSPFDFHVTRADIAIDLVNYMGDFYYLCMDHLLQVQGDRVRIFRLRGGMVFSIKYGSSRTIYLGSPTSDQLLRIYDKKYQLFDERIQSWKESCPYSEYVDNVDSWIRIELQLRTKKIPDVLYCDAEDMNDFYMLCFKYIYDNFTFTDLSTTSMNCAPAKFWSDLWKWEEIGSIIQNANTLQLISEADRVVNNSIRYENFLIELRDFYGDVNQFIDNIINRRRVPQNDERLEIIRLQKNSSLSKKLNELRSDSRCKCFYGSNLKFI